MNATEQKQAAELEKFIDSHNFRYFKGAELTPYWDSVRQGVKNTVPPANLWKRIIPTLRVLDELRRRLGKPITFTSTYRSPAYNRTVEGASHSLHMEFNATDIQSSASPSEVWRAAKKLRDEGFFKGGIGRYNTFTHIDTRGYNADW